MKNKSIMIIIVGIFLNSINVFASDFKWYIVNESLNKAHNSLHIGDTLQKIELRGGWSCEIGQTSINNSRQTTCQNEDQVIEFSVQCDQNQSKDHVQVRFKNSPGERVDFIEVGCTNDGI